eukprot:7103054-Pyramimonas_sp.AAC.1
MKSYKEGEAILRGQPLDRQHVNASMGEMKSYKEGEAILRDQPSDRQNFNASTGEMKSYKEGEAVRIRIEGAQLVLSQADFLVWLSPSTPRSCQGRPN